MKTNTLIAQKLAELVIKPEMSQKEKDTIYRKRYYLTHLDKIKKDKRKWRLINKERINQYNADFKKANPEVIKNRNIKYRLKYKDKIKKYALYYCHTLRGRFNFHAYSCKKINRENTLDYEKYCSLIQKPCFYCDRHPKENDWNGVDRKNNDVGYLIENCVSCCWECNSTKRAKKFDQWMSWLDRIRKRAVQEERIKILQSVGEEVKKKYLSHKDYGKHVHIFVFENKGRCGICKMSWKDTEKESIYNQALSDLRIRLKEMENSLCPPYQPV